MEWIYLEIEESDAIPLAEELMNEDLRREGYEIEDTPRVTVLPRFETSGRIELPVFEPPQQLSVSGLKFWPDIEDPMIVMLDVSEDMVVQLWRDEMLIQIGEDAVKDELRPPHITLFKAGEYGDEYDFTIDDTVRNQLLEESDEIEVPAQVRATDLHLKHW